MVFRDVFVSATAALRVAASPAGVAIVSVGRRRRPRGGAR